MRITIDTTLGILQSDQSEHPVPLYSPAAFEVISKLWLKVGWAQKYSYRFTWLGRPIVQLPEDMVRIQELIFQVRPTLIIETGVAHGGSLIFYASLFESLGNGRVIGIDIRIRPENRTAIQNHPLSHRLSLVEGSSIESTTINTVTDLLAPDDRVLVILDSNHAYDHVLAELRLYSPFVSQGSYIVATDGIMADLTDVPNGNPDWLIDNPQRAVQTFLTETSEFELIDPSPQFNESPLQSQMTYWPSAYLRKL